MYPRYSGSDVTVLEAPRCGSHTRGPGGNGVLATLSVHSSTRSVTLCSRDSAIANANAKVTNIEDKGLRPEGLPWYGTWSALTSQGATEVAPTKKERRHRRLELAAHKSANIA